MVHRRLSSPGPGEASAGARGERVEALLLDLDGTLADTLPDLAEALNRALAGQGLPPLAPCRCRALVSEGSGAMIRAAIGPDPDAGTAERLRRRFLAHYEERIAVHTRLFPGMEAALRAIEARGLAWGIVTNKPKALALRLVEALGLRERAACVVGGGGTPHPKPHPGPLLHACRILGADPRRCLFAGDARGDVAAGRAAGIRSLVARYGYLPDSEDPGSWGAHGYLDHPLDLLRWIDGDREAAPPRSPATSPGAPAARPPPP